MKRIFSFVLLLSLLLSACGNAVGEHTQNTTFPADIMQQENPAEDDVMNVFFVSNSTCSYFPDELHGMLTAAGYEKVNLCLAYYSGCSLEKHYNWLQTDEANYKVSVWNEEGRKFIENCSLKMALQLYNWDVISFDNNARSFSSGDVQTAYNNAQPYFEKLLAFMKEQFPASQYFWHACWTEEVGYNISYKMETEEQRTQIYNAKRGVAELIQKNYGLGVIPTGEAWEKVRKMELFTTPIEGVGADRFTLCSRINNGAFKDDGTHDGDIGGGQYLNACVWFEILTGKSCVGNTFRPEYKMGSLDCSLTEEKIQVLQKAAHEAVEAIK